MTRNGERGKTRQGSYDYDALLLGPPVMAQMLERRLLASTAHLNTNHVVQMREHMLLHAVAIIH